jgi:hypothetical protein
MNMFDFSSSNSGSRAKNSDLFLNMTSGLQIQNATVVEEKAKYAKQPNPLTCGDRIPPNPH